MYPAGEPGIEAHVVGLPDGQPFRFATAGPGDGTPVVLAHGWGASLYGFRELLPPLAALGCRAISIDLHGYTLGAPPAPPGVRPHTTEGMTQRLAAILDALGVHRPILAGHSMSGRLVLDYAVAHPERVRGVAVIAPIGIGHLRRGVRRAAMPVLRIGRFIGPVAVRRWIIRGIVAAVTGRLRRPSERDIDEYWAPTQFKSYLATVHELIRDFDWRALPADRLAGVPVPIRVLLGELDPIIRAPKASLLAVAMSPHKVQVIPGCGHIIPDEAPRAVFDALRELVAVSA